MALRINTSKMLISTPVVSAKLHIHKIVRYWNVLKINRNILTLDLMRKFFSLMRKFSTRRH